ncbi:MAG TPA: ice-binding family protein [Edaphocola sp.]|nr:ice-binding family protein [Edaphocola sp.]
MKKLLLYILPAIILIAFSQSVMAQAPNLGSVGDFVLFTSTGAVTNTGNSFLTGNVGTGTPAGISGFGNVNGVMHSNDGATANATTDLLTAYNNIYTTTATGSHAPALANDTFTAGVYAIAGNSTLNGVIVLDANNDPNAVFIFKIAGTFATSTASEIILINGAQSSNVFWTVEGVVSIGGQSLIKGTMIANNAAIDIASDAVIDGRMLSTTGAITLLNTTAKIPSGGRPVLTGPVAPIFNSIGCYAIFSRIGQVTNSGITNVKGDVGTNNGLTTGYDPLIVNGTIHPIPDTSTTAAAADLVNAYDYLNTLPYDIELLYPAQFGNNLVLTPHTYLMNAAPNFVGTVYLDGEGNADAIFVIQINGALSTGTYAKVELINGTQAKNVYWKVEGAVSIADYSEFKGTIIANNGAISLATGATVLGRILSTTGLVTTTAATVTSDLVCNSSPTPLTWLYFRGKAEKQTVVLEWATANEKNIDYFTIEKSNDGRNFTELTSVKSKLNESINNLYYTITDDQPFASTFYRITQTDMDGIQNYYKVINIKMGENAGFQATYYTKGNTIYIQTIGADAGNGSVELFSLDGKKVISKKIFFTEGNCSFQINQFLNKGLYILIIESNGRLIHKGKIGIQ